MKWKTSFCHHFRFFPEQLGCQQKFTWHYIDKFRCHVYFYSRSVARYKFRHAICTNEKYLMIRSTTRFSKIIVCILKDPGFNEYSVLRIINFHTVESINGTCSIDSVTPVEYYGFHCRFSSQPNELSVWVLYFVLMVFSFTSSLVVNLSDSLVTCFVHR